ncbi:MAG: hypothetical protein RIT28_701 [Pseudomonadota bacterium]|jgi:hypothetical protein
MKNPVRVPFFARFVELDAPPISTGLRAGINLPGLKVQTMKHPSDSDEGGFVERVGVTIKPAGDHDE